VIVGLNAPQGAGKTTLVSLIREVIEYEYGLNTIEISIDDFYKTNEQRNYLAKTIHPLLATRGVPGTHDVTLAIETLTILKSAQNQACHLIPRFDKAIDDRLPETNWTKIESQVDLILFEGWCLGSTPQNQVQLDKALNTLEQEEDKNGTWRNYVNRQLSTKYQDLFLLVDYWILASAPSFEVVCKWRKEQEIKLISKLKANKESISQTMTEKELDYFMMFFERITRNNIRSLPKNANSRLLLDENRNSVLI